MLYQVFNDKEFEIKVSRYGDTLNIYSYTKRNKKILILQLQTAMVFDELSYTMYKSAKIGIKYRGLQLLGHSLDSALALTEKKKRPKQSS